MPEIAYPIPKLWFERLGERFRLPLWGTAFLFGLGPFIILGAVSSSLPGGAFVAPVGASSSEVFYNILLNVLLVSSISLLTFYTGRYLRREIIGLLDYATSLQSRFTSGSPKLRLNNLSSAPRTMISFAILGSFTFPLFILGGTGTYFENAAGEIPYVWLIFIMASFFWIFGYSMYAIYRMGKLPLILRPYSQDRTLGLRPFAKASLNSTLIYATAATAMVVPVVLSGALPLKLALLFLALYPVGFLLFLLPLRSLHAKLMEAKAEALAKVTPRYERLVEAMNAGGKVNDEVANEMAVVIAIRNDLQQIRTWPFDAGIIVRLLAIVISVVAILLSALIRDFLHI